MSFRNSLIAAGNTYNPCLKILKSKGYSIWAEETDENVLWSASRDGDRFSGYSPPELLGIVVLWETYGEDWNQQQPNVIAEVLGSAEN